jgi:phosphatidylserine decarboxylase
MVREGYWFGLPPLVLGILSIALGRGWLQGLGVVLLLLGLFVFSFFRDPNRTIPAEPGLVVAPADGRVVVVKEETESERPGKRISIFLAIWNVHVNRAPASGTITKVDYKPGKFLAAWDENASFQNERNVFRQTTDFGEIVYKQIAGWVARRVVSWKKPGDQIARGERIGLVRFGSRVDLWLPAEAEILVKVGDNVKGGSSVVARLTAGAAARTKPASSHASSSQQTLQDERGS